MVVMRFREIVKEGHSKEYKAVCKAWNEAAVRLGLEPFRYYISEWGDRNEYYGEAEYPDAADMAARFDKANAAGDAAYDEAGKAILTHLVEGRSYDWLLKPVSLD